VRGRTDTIASSGEAGPAGLVCFVATIIGEGGLRGAIAQATAGGENCATGAVAAWRDHGPARGLTPG
jgi:hypothetical protein